MVADAVELTTSAGVATTATPPALRAGRDPLGDREGDSVGRPPRGGDG